MKLMMFSVKKYEKPFFQHHNQGRHQLEFVEARLTRQTLPLVQDTDAVCGFVHDQFSAEVLEGLAERGVRLVLLRCAGFNNVDIDRAQSLGLTVARVPEYSPFAVAEHTIALMLTLNRKLHRAYYRGHTFNFALDGLMGFDMHGKTAGVVGLGRIGLQTARILSGFGMDVLGFDPNMSEEAAGLVRQVEWQTLLQESDIISLHCPLTPATHHLIDEAALSLMKPGVMLINTSRGALVDTKATIAALKTGALGALGLDVYEEEADLFYEDLSNQRILDDTFARLMTFPNVVVTSHQGFFTREAMESIARVTLENLSDYPNIKPINLVGKAQRKPKRQ